MTPVPFPTSTSFPDELSSPKQNWCVIGFISGPEGPVRSRQRQVRREITYRGEHSPSKASAGSPRRPRGLGTLGVARPGHRRACSEHLPRRALVSGSGGPGTPASQGGRGSLDQGVRRTRRRTRQMPRAPATAPGQAREEKLRQPPRRWAPRPVGSALNGPASSPAHPPAACISEQKKNK